MKKPSKFLQGFSQSIKYPLTPTIADLPRYIVYPFVYFVSAFPKIKPEDIVLLGFLFNLAATFFLFFDFSIFCSILLIVNVLLDYADGQLARYTHRVSTLGGLFDLTSDFIGLAILYLAIAIHGSGSNYFYLLVLAAFICHVLSATISSYYYQYINNNEMNLNRFVSLPSNDRPDDSSYTKKFSILVQIHKYTWIAASQILIKSGLLNRIKNNKLSTHIMAFGDIGIITIALSICFLISLPFQWFFIYLLTLLLIQIGICKIT